MSKLAILQMADTPQIESTAVMLRYAGYEVKVCGGRLRDELKRVGCDTVLSVESMVAMGYDELDPSIARAQLEEMDSCDLFVEIKVRNLERIWSRWPRLRNRAAWWRVNGAQPEICAKGGDEVNFPCPIITACLWYGTQRYRREPGKTSSQGQSLAEHEAGRPVTIEKILETHARAKIGANGLAYTFWPPYPRSDQYLSIDRGNLSTYDAPYCLCHNVQAWGYGEIVVPCVKEGMRFYGNGSPHGQISHSLVPRIASEALALVHLKSVDCPGWALYEALLAGCPVVVGRLLNSRMLAYDLLSGGDTCLEFGVPASLEYGRGDPDLEKCLRDIKEALVQLHSPKENQRIGENGRRRLKELMWTPARDGDSFNLFMKELFK